MMIRDSGLFLRATLYIWCSCLITRNRKS